MSGKKEKPMSEISGDAFIERAEAIQSQADFSAFLHLLLRNYREYPAEWENQTLEQFLGAMDSFVNSIDGYYTHTKADVDLSNPGWRVFADVLLAGRVYE